MSKKEPAMKTELDTIREVYLDWKTRDTTQAEKEFADMMEGGYSISSSAFLSGYLAALSAIDSDAKPQEPNTNILYVLQDWIDSFDGEIIVTNVALTGLHDRFAALITAHDDAIRRGCADKGRKEFRKITASPNQRDIPAFKAFRDNQADQIHAAILGTEPALGMHDLDPEVADCVQKNFNELIGPEPAREKSCETCKYDGMQGRFRSGCTGCGSFDEYKNYEPAREGPSCKTCKHDGYQNIYPSGCTGCGSDGEFLHYEPARDES